MAKELFNRYVWLIDTLQRYGRLTRGEIDGLWQRSEYSDGKPMARRTFMNYRQAIQEMFDVNIECDASTYEYYLGDSLRLREAGFLGGDVDVVVDVAVAGGEVALCHTQEQTALVGGKLYHIDHNCTLLFL